MEISTGDLIGLSGLGVTIIGGAVALGKVWSKVIANERTNTILDEKLTKLSTDAADMKTLTMVQQSTIDRLDANNNKLFEIAEDQGKLLSDIKSELGIIIEKLKTK